MRTGGIQAFALPSAVSPESSVHSPAPLQTLQASWAWDEVVALIGTVSQNCVAPVGHALESSAGFETAWQLTVTVAVAEPPPPIAVNV